MTRKYIYLVRHGQYVSSHGLPGEQPDGGLTATGQEQANLTAQRLLALPITLIHHSTTQRTTETAAIIARQFPYATICPSDLLRECIPSVPEAFKVSFAEVPPEVIERGGLQAAQAYEMYFKPPAASDGDQHEVIVAHGNIINSFICRTLEAPLDGWVRLDIFNCAICEITIRPSGFMKLACQNDAGHLPSYLKTVS
jgi:serine/threonine-protein phosphatase PGAM5